MSMNASDANCLMPLAPCAERHRQRLSTAERGRIATSVVFLVDGMTFGTWAASIPYLQQKFALSHGQLSWALLGLIAGAMVSMPVAGRLVARWGSDRIAFPSALGFAATLPLLALAPNFGALIAAAVLFGACKGMLDVSVNAQGVAVETAIGRPVFSTFQGFWSLGGLVAASSLSVAMHHGWPAATLIYGMAAILFFAALACFGRLLPERLARVPAPAKRIFTRPSRRLLQLGALAFLGLFSEGVLLDWSAVYAHTIGGVSVAVAPVAFGVFALSMASGRFIGDWLSARFGPAGLLRASGLLITVGIAIAAVLHAWGAILAGFAMVGFGIANLVPIIFSAAARTHPQGAGPAIATVSTLGYIGFLAGPPVIGLLAGAAGLPSAFGLVVVFGILLTTVGTAIIRPAPPGRSHDL